MNEIHKLTGKLEKALTNDDYTESLRIITTLILELNSLRFSTLLKIK